MSTEMSEVMAHLRQEIATGRALADAVAQYFSVHGRIAFRDANEADAMVKLARRIKCSAWEDSNDAQKN